MTVYNHFACSTEKTFSSNSEAFTNCRSVLVTGGVIILEQMAVWNLSRKIPVFKVLNI